MKLDRKASWRKLNLLIVITLAILFMVTTADMSPLIHKVLEIAIIVPGYTLVGSWAYCNAAALEAEDRERQILSRRRRPWYPSWWRPGLNQQQYHYLLVKHGVKRLQKETVG